MRARDRRLDHQGARPDQLWRITGSKDLRGRAAAVLRALWQWRDAEAQAVDRPTFHILHNEQLIDAAAPFDRGQEVDFPQLKGGRRRRFFEAAERPSRCRRANGRNYPQSTPAPDS